MEHNVRRRAERELEHIDAKIEALKSTLAALAAHRDRLRGFLSVWDELAPDLGEGVDPTRPLAGDSKLSQYEAAKKALRHHGEPLGPRDIAEAMVRLGFEYDGDFDTLAASVRGALHRSYRGDPEVFKPERGLYALTVWRDGASGPKGEQQQLLYEIEQDEQKETPESAGTDSGAIAEVEGSV